MDPTELDDPDDVMAALRTRPPSSVALVVGHTNTVPEIIAGLGGPADVTIDHDEFDRLFVLSGTRLTPPSLRRLMRGRRLVKDRPPA